MTEREYEDRKAAVRKMRANAMRDVIAASHEVRKCDERLTDLLGAAVQEPWWGEAND